MHKVGLREPRQKHVKTYLVKCTMTYESYSNPVLSSFIFMQWKQRSASVKYGSEPVLQPTQKGVSEHKFPADTTQTQMSGGWSLSRYCLTQS